MTKGRILAQSTRGGRRWPWLLAAVGVPVFGMMAAFGTVNHAPEPLFTQAVVESLPVAGSVQPAATESAFFHEDRYQRGDTLAALLQRLGADDTEAGRLLASRDAVRAVRQLRPGTIVQAVTDEAGGLKSLSFASGRESITILRQSENGFTASEGSAGISRRLEMKSGEITSSLFAATDAADVPDSIAGQIAEVFAGDIDFHRDLRRGDRFTVVFEMFYHEGRAVRSGRVLGAEFTNQRKTHRAVWYQPPEGNGGYYTPEGKILRRAFLRSPLEFSRITSGFGMRHHPILQQWRAHRGVDYGAPTGTRVRATGDGVIDFAGRNNGYGNLVVMRHAAGISTYYAHLSRFGHGLRRGTRVAQGETIGYVGQTGWATGPHLHYEFHVNNQHRNPLTIALPGAQPLSPYQLTVFSQSTQPLAARLDLLKNSNLALLE